MRAVESRPTRVLLVDDHELFVESAKAVLEADVRFDVVGTAMNGSDAVVLAGELEPDLVLMDIAMPGMDGVEATRAIKERCPGARVVMLTGRSGRSEEEGSGAAGAIGYLSKHELTSPHLADSLDALVELS
jgi:two-component system, NarL family, nitrate/nitrite response regulator NarL